MFFTRLLQIILFNVQVSFVVYKIKIKQNCDAGQHSKHFINFGP